MRWQRIMLIVAIIIVFGLMPSITVLILNILDQSSPRDGLAFTQIFLFILGTFCYFFFGSIGHAFLVVKEHSFPS